MPTDSPETDCDCADDLSTLLEAYGTETEPEAKAGMRRKIAALRMRGLLHPVRPEKETRDDEAMAFISAYGEEKDPRVRALIREKLKTMR